MTIKEIQAMSDQDLVDALCYACWREYNSACRNGGEKKVVRKIVMFKEEIERRMTK